MNGRISQKAEQKSIFTVRDLAYTALACALIAACAWITIPLPINIPITLQTMAVLFCAGLLGTKRGVAAVVVYLLLGLCGVPVFSSFRSGPSVLLGPTGGYLIGFLFTALIVGVCADRGKRRVPALLLGMLAGIVAYYVFGTFWYFFLYLSESGLAGLWAATVKCVLPFLPFDAVKAALAIFLIRRLDGIVDRGR